MRSPRILVLHASVGSGHTRAAEAVCAALRELEPSATVRCLDVLELANPAFRKVYGGGYLSLASSAPHVLGYLYDFLDRPAGKSESLRTFVSLASLRAFRRLLIEEPWDAIVHTHFLPAEIVASLRRSGRLHVPHAVVVTDFDAHRLWANLPCERFFVASPEGSASLRQWGVDAETIVETGIPIHPAFAKPVERRRILREHSLSGDRPIVLQLAGGFGMGPIEETFAGICRVEAPCDIVVVTGRNEEARRRLAALPAPARHRAQILGFTSKMHELMSVATLVVSKPGGLTTSEALACGVPMAVVQPVPGQETRNCDFLLENGAAIKINALPAIGEKIDGLLAAAGRLARMRRAAANLGRPKAAFQVAREAIELAGRFRESQVFEPSVPLPAIAADPTLSAVTQANSANH